MGKPAISKEKIDLIKSLRKRGNTVSEIQTITSVGRATVSRYIQNVDVSDRFKSILKSKQGGSTYRSKKLWQDSRDKSKEYLKSVSKRDKILIAACLYWGEGNKKEFNLSNTDPGLILTFVSCLYELGVSKSDLRVTLRIYEDMDRQKVINYWANLLGIKNSEIQNVNILKGKKKGKLKYGLCRLRIKRGGNHFKFMMSMIDLIRLSFNAPVVQRIERGTPKP